MNTDLPPTEELPETEINPADEPFVTPVETEETSSDSEASGSSLSRFQRREKAAADAMHTLFRDFYLERFNKEPETPQELSLKLDISCVAGGNWDLKFEPSLYEQLQNQLEDLGGAINVYVPGCVYDFFSESSRDSACTPPTQLSVFKGYDSKGIPCWHDLMQALLQCGDERTAQLYDRTPRILATMIYGKELHKEQLRSYGRSTKTYSILGQVVSGYHQLPAQLAIQDDRRLALTFQIVETRSANREFQLELNVLSVLDPETLQNYIAHEKSGGLSRSISIARREVEKLQQQVRATRRNGDTTKAGELLRRVPSILKSLCSSLERNHRQDSRRTNHAQDRRAAQRPVHKAQDDAREVRADRLFYDLKHHSWVVVAEAGRTHAFSQEGKHITSFTIKPDSIAFRVRTERWRETTPDEFSTFKDTTLQTV